MRRTFVVLIALACPGAAAVAQQPVVHLAEARQRALASNPALTAAGDDVAALRASAGSAGRWPGPVFSLSREGSGSGPAATSQIIGAVTQDLDLSGRLRASGEAARLYAGAADVRLAATRARLREDVTLAWARSVAAAQRLAIVARSAQSFERAVAIATERRAAGDIAGLDDRRLRLESARANARWIGARLALDSATAQLRGLMGADPRDTSAVQLPPLIAAGLTGPLPNLDSLLAASRRFAVASGAADAEAGALGAEANAAARARWPMPSLTLGFKREQLAPGTTGSGLVAGLAIPLRIWNSGRGDAAAAQFNASAATARAAGLRRTEDLEIAAIWRSLTGLGDQLALLTRDIAEHAPPIRQALSVAMAEGELDLTAWLDAMRTDQDAGMLHADLWQDRVSRLARLERLTGLPLVQEIP